MNHFKPSTIIVFLLPLIELVAVSVASNAFGQNSPSTSAERKWVRERLVDEFEWLNSPSSQDSLAACARVAHLMWENGAKADFASDFLCTNIEQKLRVSIPEEWRKDVDNYFTLRKNVKTDEQNLTYRFRSGTIFGPAGSFPVPSDFDPDAPLLFTAENDKWLCVVGRRQFYLTNLLIFDKHSEKGPTSTPLQLSTEPMGRRWEMMNIIQIRLQLDTKKNVLYLFCTLPGTLWIDSVELSSCKVNSLFHSNRIPQIEDALPKKE